MTQYGKLTTLEVTDSGSFINSKHASGVCLTDLQLAFGSPITIRIGNKEDAEFIGGFNLFGEKFGDYAQDIVLSFVY